MLKLWGSVAKTIVDASTAKWPCVYRGNKVATDKGNGVFICELMRSRLCVANRDLRNQAGIVTVAFKGPAGETQTACGNCAGCSLRKAQLPKLPKIARRNLIYHVCPLKANDQWRLNLQKLKQHMGAFNGRKLIATACYGPGENKGYATHRSWEVHNELSGMNCDFMDVSNDPILRERTTFLQLLLSIASDSREEATFYGHSKGIATLETSDHTMPDDMRIQGSIRWRNAMYAHLLGRWEEAMKYLRRYACVGATQIACPGIDQWIWPGNQRWGYWHFAGTFFWFRHDEIFTRPGWRNIWCDHYGVEAWLGGFVPLAHSYSILQPFDKFGPPPFRVYEPATYGSEFDV